MTEKGKRLHVKRRYGEPGMEKEFTPVDDREYKAYCERMGLEPDSYTLSECMAVAAARECPDGAFLFRGYRAASDRVHDCSTYLCT